jgi:ABC-type branched-subunit amino acid transport system permease subunit
LQTCEGCREPRAQVNVTLRLPVFVVVTDVLNGFVGGYVIVVGATLILTVIFLPDGLVGAVRGRVRRW